MTRRPAGALPHLNNTLRSSKGVATIEFGVVVSMLCTLVLGLIDFGVGIWTQMQVTNAARAGAQYAMMNPFDATSIQNAVTNATSLAGVSALPVPKTGYGCPDMAAGIVSAANGSACTAGGAAQCFTTIYAQASYSTIFPWPAIARPMTLKATIVANNC